MDNPPVNAASLANLGCGMPGCKHDHSVLYLHSRCHPSAGTRARYVKKDQELIIDCRKCGKEVIRIAVAP